jgi:hypothetical protein
MTLLGIDTESGGIGLEYSLLSINFSIIDDNCEIVESLDLKLKPDPINGRSEYFVQAEALRVNKINLAQHDLEAISYKESKSVIYKWLEKTTKEYGNFTVFGQKVERDVELITRYTISENSWYNFVNRRVIDTISLGKYAQLIGLIPETQSLSLSKITDYLGVEVDENRIHDAQYDVMLGAQYLKWFKDNLK